MCLPAPAGRRTLEGYGRCPCLLCRLYFPLPPTPRPHSASVFFVLYTPVLVCCISQKLPAGAGRHIVHAANVHCPPAKWPQSVLVCCISSALTVILPLRTSALYASFLVCSRCTHLSLQGVGLPRIDAESAATLREKRSETDGEKRTRSSCSVSIPMW